ncbi:MAG: RHS repeat-associated core domain-containing protein [Nitrospiraceae bacterium]
MVAIGNHGRPTQVTSGTLLTTHFKHNGRGERVWVDNVGGTQLANFPDKTLHFDESGKVLAEHWPGGVMYEYLYVDEVPVAFVKYDGAIGGGTGTVYYYHSDHLNTPRYATDATGTLVWASGFPGEDPFRPGSMSAYGLNLEPRLRFPGQYYQAETGAVYNYFRDYDVVTGRYLQSDPIGLEGGINTYAYANSNPLRFTDPYGLWTWPSPGDVASYWGQAIGGSGDFGGAYADQWRATNTIGGAHNGWANQDVYFHCRANCEAAQRGPGGEDAAQCFSDARENWDEFWGQSSADTRRDQSANRQGRNGGSIGPGESCQKICGSYRPGGSFPAGW